MKHPKSSNSNKTIILLIGGFTLLALVLIGFVAVGEQKKAEGGGAIIQYQVAETEKPIAVADSNFQDIGRMSITDEKTVTFTLTNSGTKPLQLYNVSSSCDCTAGVITINGVHSPEASMHEKNSWTGTLGPGEKAIVSVIYRPSIMPVTGDISRSVSVETNDPDNSQLTFTIKTFVE